MNPTASDARYSIYRFPSTGTLKVMFYPTDAQPFQPRLPLWLDSHPPEIEPDISSMMYLSQMIIADAGGRRGVEVGPLYSDDGKVQLMCQRFAIEVIAPIRAAQLRILPGDEVTDWVRAYRRDDEVGPV
jgi:hypothetical protein